MGSLHVLLTFDLEEFDIPNEYGSNLPWDEQMAIGRRGMTALIEVLETYNTPTTIFTTAAYAVENEDQLKRLAQKNEIASHTFYHSSYKTEDLLRSRETLSSITGSKVYGLRMPRMRPVMMNDVAEAGYTYDSSINPTLIPGKYNNTHLPKTVYAEEGVLRVPCSVSPTLRIPLFWLAFKNFPYAFYKALAIQSLKKYGYINLYFHPWEFTDISAYNLPGYIKKDSGTKLTGKLEKLISNLKQEADFITMHEFLQHKAYTH